MQLNSVMRGGCNNCVIHIGINNKLSNSSKRMKKKRNVADGNKKEILLGDSKDQRKLQTTLPDMTSQFMRLLILRNPQWLLSHQLQILHFNK